MPAGAAAYDVFLSYSRADAAAADQLRTRLAEAGLKTFLDRYSLPGGKPWQPELETALGHCRALVVLLGPAGIGGWQHREIQLGLVRQGAAEKTASFFLMIHLFQPDNILPCQLSILLLARSSSSRLAYRSHISAIW